MTRPRPAARIRAAVSVAAVVATVLAALVACGRSSAPAPSYGSGPGAPTIAQVTALLSRHARAVHDKSSARFLADVDASDAAAAFRRQQAGEIAALAAVPLRSWSYTVTAPVTDQGRVRAAAARFGAPASIVHLTLSYALAVDTTALTHDLWWTFVQRHGHVYAAGDSDLTGLGGQSWHGPWDYGPIVVQRGAHSLVLAHPAESAELPAISSAVDAAVTAVSAVWGTAWNRQVAVEVPGSAAEFAALGGSGGGGSGGGGSGGGGSGGAGSGGSGSGGSDYSAETIFETSGGADSAARVLLNPAVLTTLTPVGLGIVLRHEITHAATIADTPIGSPTWLVEGFADYVANLTSGQSVTTAASELTALVRAGHLPSALPTESDFAASTGLAAVYEQAWLACRLIAADVGTAGLVRLYQLVGASLTTADTAVANAFRTVLHESVAAFTARWRTYLRTELR